MKADGGGDVEKRGDQGIQKSGGTGVHPAPDTKNNRGKRRVGGVGIDVNGT